MADKLLFLTGHLAENRLVETIQSMGLEEGSWRVHNIGIKVAALMTESIIRNRLKTPLKADRVILPGRVRADLQTLSQYYGVTFERGPDEFIDLPTYLGKAGHPPDLTQYDMTIFAEIVDAPTLTLDRIVERALYYSSKGADVIDIGCQPDTSFPQLELVVKTLKELGLMVSVDSGDVNELRRAVITGADYVLSLDETNLEIITGYSCTPILVPKPHGDLSSLFRGIEKARKLGIEFIADPILDPINFGFTDSIQRYVELRKNYPDCEILMGTGNLTELTDADSQGVTAALLGIASELRIKNVLIVQVSPHTRRTIEEHDAIRRVMFRSREDRTLPKGLDARLISLHDLIPFPSRPEDIQKSALDVKDANFRIEVALDGIHIFNRDGHHVVQDPFDAFSHLRVDHDGSHAFYLGYELAKAEIALSLGKRYSQDNPLNWGVAADQKNSKALHHAPTQENNSEKLQKDKSTLKEVNDA